MEERKGGRGNGREVGTKVRWDEDGEELCWRDGKEKKERRKGRRRNE